MMDFEKKWLKGGNIFDSRDTYKYVGVFDEILSEVSSIHCYAIDELVLTLEFHLFLKKTYRKTVTFGLLETL